MAELSGKGKRVLGTFVLMVGAGVILDSHVLWLGVSIMIVGAIGFMWGILETHPRPMVGPAVRPEVAPESPAVVGGSTKGQL